MQTNTEAVPEISEELKTSIIDRYNTVCTYPPISRYNTLVRQYYGGSEMLALILPTFVTFLAATRYVVTSTWSALLSPIELFLAGLAIIIGVTVLALIVNAMVVFITNLISEGRILDTSKIDLVWANVDRMLNSVDYTDYCASTYIDRALVLHDGIYYIIQGKFYGREILSARTVTAIGPRGSKNVPWMDNVPTDYATVTAPRLVGSIAAEHATPADTKLYDRIASHISQVITFSCCGFICYCMFGFLFAGSQSLADPFVYSMLFGIAVGIHVQSITGKLSTIAVNRITQNTFLRHME